LVHGRLGRDYARAEREIRGFLEIEIAKRREAARASGDLLTMLVSARFFDGSGMSNEQIHDEARTGPASYDTSSAYLGVVPAGAFADAESKLVAEVTVRRVSRLRWLISHAPMRAWSSPSRYGSSPDVAVRARHLTR
jgi:hypothetical protein